MSEPRPFLTARWANLVLLTFEAPAKLVRAALHRELEPDRWSGCTHVSLVAFDFRDTRVMGCLVPGLENFPEINLRTYARHQDDRGVIFLRELVPSRLVATVARWRYNEPYQVLAMRSSTRSGDGLVTVTHRFGAYRLRAVGSITSSVPPDSSVEHHFKEHTWGFGTTRSGRLLRYRVEHPEWAIRELRDVDYDIDFRALYGNRWGFLNERTPVSTIFAVGSEVRVYPPKAV